MTLRTLLLAVTLIGCAPPSDRPPQPPPDPEQVYRECMFNSGWDSSFWARDVRCKHKIGVEVNFDDYRCL